MLPRPQFCSPAAKLAFSDIQIPRQYMLFPHPGGLELPAEVATANEGIHNFHNPFPKFFNPLDWYSALIQS